MHTCLTQALHTNDTLEDLQVAWNCIVVSPVSLFTTSLTLFATCLFLFATCLPLFTSGLELHRRESFASFHNFPISFCECPGSLCVSLFTISLCVPFFATSLCVPLVITSIESCASFHNLPYTICPHSLHPSIFVYMGWLRLIGCFKIHVSLQNIGLFCRALLH